MEDKHFVTNGGLQNCILYDFLGLPRDASKKHIRMRTGFRVDRAPGFLGGRLSLATASSGDRTKFLLDKTGLLMP